MNESTSVERYIKSIDGKQIDRYRCECSIDQHDILCKSCFETFNKMQRWRLLRNKIPILVKYSGVRTGALDFL